jgi:hypothetical protein
MAAESEMTVNAHPDKPVFSGISVIANKFVSNTSQMIPIVFPNEKYITDDG